MIKKIIIILFLASSCTHGNISFQKLGDVSASLTEEDVRWAWNLHAQGSRNQPDVIIYLLPHTERIYRDGQSYIGYYQFGIPDEIWLVERERSPCNIFEALPHELMHQWKFHTQLNVDPDHSDPDWKKENEWLKQWRDRIYKRCKTSSNDLSNE